MKPKTHWRRKAFPKTPTWLLYEVQCHTRWARTLGSPQNLTLNMPNEPMPLKIYSKKLRCCVYVELDVHVLIWLMENKEKKSHGEKVEWIRQGWPLFMREGYLCEQGERSSLGYEAADVWCWQEALTFGVFSWLRVAVKLVFFPSTDDVLHFTFLLAPFSSSSTPSVSISVSGYHLQAHPTSVTAVSVKLPSHHFFLSLVLFTDLPQSFHVAAD